MDGWMWYDNNKWFHVAEVECENAQKSFDVFSNNYIFISKII